MNVIAVAGAMVAAMALIQPSSALAASKTELDIPPDTLSRSIVALGKQAHISIIIVNPAMDQIRTQRLRGRLSPEAALRRLLANTGLTFRKTRNGDFVVIRASPSIVDRPIGRPPSKPDRGDEEEATIVVIASKNGSLLKDYPGSLSIVDMGSNVVSTRSSRGTAAIIDQLPVLAGTSLGPGRNKLFARGVADSSFNGQSQTNVGLYFGDFRLTYNGPDPDLDLFDVKKVEVLAGPYGTLYGAGTLGGIIRIEANQPDLHEFEGRITADVASVSHGATGFTSAGMLNLPVISDRIGMRLVGYRTTEPGFIDDLDRGKNNINGVITTGGRLAVTLHPDETTSLDFGLIVQSIRAKDAQYTTEGPNSLSARSPIAQPFSSDYLMPNLSFRTSLGSFTLTSAMSLSLQRANDLYYFDSDISFSQRRRSALISNETRVSSDIDNLKIVAGLSFSKNHVRENLDFDELSLSYVNRYDQIDIALFGEVSYRFSSNISATVGARIGHIWTNAMSEYETGKQSTSSFLPAAALSWTPDSGLQIYASYRTGFRGGNPTLTGFRSGSDPDHIASVEGGFRYKLSTTLRISGALSRSVWKDIQSDLLGASGQELATNLGDAHIIGLETDALWNPVPAMSLGFAAFFNNGPVVRLNETAADAHLETILAASLRIPGIAKTSVRALARYEGPLFGDIRFNLGLAVRYYGPSKVERQRTQPGYAEVGLDARLVRGKSALTLGITNLFDVYGNRFAIGNEIRSSQFGENQFTPLQPRTISIGLDANF